MIYWNRKISGHASNIFPYWTSFKLGIGKKEKNANYSLKTSFYASNIYLYILLYSFYFRTCDRPYDLRYYNSNFFIY